MSKNKDADKISVTKMYETLRSSDFLKSLYWDVLSDLHEKPTFKKMKETLKEIVNRNLEAISVNKCKSDVDKNYIISTLCSLAFTTDAIYSKILFRQLDQEFNTQILKIIKQLRSEGEISDDVWDQLEISTTSEEDIKGTTSLTMQKAESPIKSESVSVRKRKQKTACNKDKVKNVSKNSAGKPKELPESKMGTRSQAVPKKTASQVATCSKSPEKTNSIKEEIKAEIAAVNSNLSLNEGQDSDTDSIISVGNASLAFVSSVHTSDLSSFDDEISVSSGDEGTKRRVSIKELIEKKASGKLNGFKKETQNSEESHCSNSSGSSQVKASVQPTDKTADSATSESLSPTHSSKRIRKPNSKYSSDTVICQSIKIKDRKKPNVPTTNTKDKSSETSPKRRRTSDTEVETPSKVQKVDAINKNISTNDKRATKENQSSDLFKPLPTVRTLTSRRTAPLTLFSSKP